MVMHASTNTYSHNPRYIRALRARASPSTTVLVLRPMLPTRHAWLTQHSHSDVEMLRCDTVTEDVGVMGRTINTSGLFHLTLPWIRFNTTYCGAFPQSRASRFIEQAICFSVVLWACRTTTRQGGQINATSLELDCIFSLASIGLGVTEIWGVRCKHRYVKAK
ncbi:hypothetical protein EI94DRAFT_971650 [Lactarius quietus]|nr:hypothetical protein EI94DRAFT_971650 [Lactarius quietus]